MKPMHAREAKKRSDLGQARKEFLRQEKIWEQIYAAADRGETQAIVEYGSTQSDVSFLSEFGYRVKGASRNGNGGTMFYWLVEW